MSSRFTQPSQDDSSYVLVARMDNAKNLSSLLKAVHFREVGTCFLSSQGLKVTVEQSKCVQANAFIQASLFQQFIYRHDESLAFKINLSVLVECLNIFGSGGGGGGGAQEGHTALKMCYMGYGSPLTLLLEESGVLTDCSIQTQDADEILDFDFCGSNVVNRVIMKADCLREVLAELDTSSDSLEILLSPSPPYCRLSTYGYAGSTQIDYPKESEMMQVFECTETLQFKYRLSLLKSCQKAVNLSTKISIRMDRRGFLSLQCMILTFGKQICFVEYLCVPDEDTIDVG